jgi:hypothetical protein
VGALLAAVQVDDWGRFRWLLLRLRGRCGRQTLLVRGANNAGDAQIVEQLHRQVGPCAGFAGGEGQERQHARLHMRSACCGVRRGRRSRAKVTHSRLLRAAAAAAAAGVLLRSCGVCSQHR